MRLRSELRARAVPGLLGALLLALSAAPPGCGVSADGAGGSASTGAGGATTGSSTTSSNGSTTDTSSSTGTSGAGASTSTMPNPKPSAIVFPDRARPWGGVVVVRAQAPVASWRIDSAALTPPSPMYPDAVLDTRPLADGPHLLSLDLVEGPKIRTYDEPILVDNGPPTPPSFTGALVDVSQAAGLLFNDPMTSLDGAVSGDLDGDGDLDLFAWKFGGGRVYLQTAPFAFQPMGAVFPSIRAAGMGDLDGDGLLDVVAVGSGIQLLHNEGGALVDVTAASGVSAMPLNSYDGVTFADVDGDGLLDVAIGEFNCSGQPGPSLILRNEGDLHFRDVAFALGLAEAMGATFTIALDVTGDDDYLHAFPFHEGCTPVTTRHFRFKPGPDLPTLVDALDPVQNENPMGSAILDADGDGLLDFWISGDTTSPLWTGPALLASTAPYAGLDVHLDQAGHPVQGWSKVLFDADLDGRPDVLTVHENTHDPSMNEGPGHSTLFWQRAPGHFRDVAPLAGLDVVPGCQAAHGADLDGDGDTDLLLGCPGNVHVLRNDLVDPSPGRTIVLHGTISNRDGIHAIVTTPSGERRVIRGGGQPFAGGLVRESVRAPNGTLTVRWPSGIEQKVPVGNKPILSITEPKAFTVTPRRVDAAAPVPVAVEVDPAALGDAAANVTVSASAGVWATPVTKDADGKWRGTLTPPAGQAIAVLTVTIGGAVLKTRPRVFVR